MTDKNQQDTSWLEDEEYEGKLAIDAYQTDDTVVIKAPVAGVKPDDLEISITDDVVTIKGARHNEVQVAQDSYLAQECYWGTFSRSYLLPFSVESEKAEAKLENGILTITLPKPEQTKTKVIKIKAQQNNNV